MTGKPQNTLKALEPLVEKSQMQYTIRNTKHVCPNKRKTRITPFIIDETQIQIDSTEARS